MKSEELELEFLLFHSQDTRRKVCNFGFSRKANKADGVTTHIGLPKTSPYKVPETFSTSASQGSKTARDIWSFYVFVYAVLVRGRIHKTVQDYPGILYVAPAGGEAAEKNKGQANLAKKIIVRANIISSDDTLREVAPKCISLKPISRPRI